MAQHPLTAAAEYLLSLPERVVRSSSAIAGGLVRELSDVSIPPRIRRTSLYTNLVESTLRFMIEQVGQVPDSYPAGSSLADDFAFRRAAGDGIEFVGILAFHASPMWVLAALADLSGAGRDLIREITASLKEEGLLDPDTEFETVSQMLDGLEKSSAAMAGSLRTPPLDIAALRQDWEALRRGVAAMPAPQLPAIGTLWQSWNHIKQTAASQQRPVFLVSSLMAFSAIARIPERLLWLSRVASHATTHTGDLFAAAILDHYTATAAEIHAVGFLNYWAREFRPYLKAAASQFSPDRQTLTQRLLRRSSRR
jgi:hypothetical protein